MNTHGLLIASNRRHMRMEDHCQNNLVEGTCLFSDALYLESMKN